jgi:hypothetical protein
MAFDYEGALAEGYSPAEIADFLGKKKKFNVAGARKEGYTDNEIITHLMEPVAEVKPAPVKEGFLPSLKEGAIGAYESTKRGVAAPFQSEEDIRAAYGVQKAAEQERNVGYTPFAAIPEAYEKEGLGAAASTTYKAARDALGRSLPYMAPTAAGAFTGARLGALTSPLTGPVGPIVGGIIGGIAGGVPQFAGTNIERRIDEKTQGPLVTPEVYSTATGQAALDTAATMFTLGTGVVAKVIGRPIAKVTEDQLAKTAERSLAGTLTRGAGRGAVSEMPTEVAQQILERKQAGLDLTSEDAYREYGEAAAAAGVLGGGLGGVGNIVTRSQARDKVQAEAQAQQLELDAINKERSRIANIAATAQREEQERLLAEDRALQAREAELRKPLKEQMELDLAPETTVEEVAAKRAAESPQGDLFAEAAPMQVAPTFELDDATIKSFGFSQPRSAAFKTLQSINDPAMPMDSKIDLFEKVIEKKGSLTPKQTEAVEKFKRFMDEHKAKEAQDELTRVAAQQGASGAGLRTDEQGGRAGVATVAEEPVAPPVDSTRADVGVPLGGTGEQYAALEAAQAPESTEVIAEPEAPAVPRITPEERQQRIIEQRAAEEEARTAEKQANLEAAKAEQAGFREAPVMPEAEREGLQAAKEFDQDQVNYEAAKDTAGAFIRQTFGGVENITPEEKVTLQQFLSALADIMYHIVKRGTRIKTDALNAARAELGEAGSQITDFQLNKAYADAVNRVDTEAKAPPAPEAPPVVEAQPAEPRALREPSAPVEGADTPTGDNIFRDLVSPRVSDARLNLGAALRKLTPKLLSMYQLVDQFGNAMPALRNYADLNDKMTMTQQRLKNKAHALLSDWGAFSFSNSAEHKKLGKLMLEATRSKIHPDEEFESEPNAHLTEDMRDKYEELSDAYNALSPEAKQIYQRARALLQENFNLRRTVYNDMVRGAYAEDLAEATPEEAEKINARIEKAVQEHEMLLNEMRGPYFPLMRFGEYLVVAESDEIRALREDLANASGSERKALIERLRQMEKSEDHYQVFAFDKRSDQAKEADKLKRQGMNVRETKSEEYMNNIRANSFGAIDQLEKIFDREIDLDIDPKDMRQLRQAMIDSVLAGLPENSALQRQIKRRNIAGATENMLQAFAETMERDSFYLSRMGFMKPMSKALIDMRNQSKNDMQLRDVYNNVRARLNLDARYDHHPILSKLTGASSIYHLGIAPSYLLQNMTQPFQITIPQLAGRYGAKNASRAVIGAWKDAKNVVKGGRGGKFFSLKDADLSQAFEGGELKMVRMLEDLGKLDIANNMDTEVYTKGMSPKAIKFWKVFNWSSHNIELMNRLSSALAAYRLEMNKTGNEEAATKAAREAVELTQLDYSDTNAAYFMKQGHMGGLNRIPMQFRKYQQGMIYLLARNFKNAWGGDAEAKRAFFYLMGTQLIMAGIRGVPVAAPLLFLMGAFGDKDDKDGDVETQLRNALADTFGNETARVFWKGLPAMVGVDSGSMSMENLFLPFPMMRSSAITDAATGKDAVTEFMFNLGGAPVSMASRVGDAFILGSEGDYQKALEKVLPKFMSSLVKAERLGSEGLTTRSGNVAIEADEFNAWDQAIKALGFTPTKEAEYYQAMYEKERITQAIDDVRNKLIKDIATARLNGEDPTEALEQVREFNIEHPSRRINGESIKRSIAQRRKDKAQRSASGVKYEKRERDISDVTRYAD